MAIKDDILPSEQSCFLENDWYDTPKRMYTEWGNIDINNNNKYFTLTVCQKWSWGCTKYTYIRINYIILICPYDYMRTIERPVHIHTDGIILLASYRFGMNYTYVSVERIYYNISCEMCNSKRRQPRQKGWR